MAQQFPAALAAAVDIKVAALVIEQLTKLEPAFAYFDAKTLELKAQLDFYEAATMFHRFGQRSRGLAKERGQTPTGLCSAAEQGHHHCCLAQ